ncbi:MAG: hypothetical protein R3A79_07580 [Nannocystaceae bacterium]
MLAPSPVSLRRARPRPRTAAAPLAALLAALFAAPGCNLTGIDTAESGGDSLCDAYLRGEATASDCVAELDCGQYADAAACGGAPVHLGDGDVGVTCYAGARFVGSYDAEAMMCVGEVSEACVAAVLVGEGGPPCFGYFSEVDAGLEVLDLGCAEPIADGYTECLGSAHEGTTCACVSG